jgi:uncharacterized protein (TIGR00251 family)
VAATLKVRVIPRARKDEIAGWRGEALVVRLTAPPVEGAANKLLVRFLAKRLGVRAGDIAITSGEKAREKVLRVEALSQGELDNRLPDD